MEQETIQNNNNNSSNSSSSNQLDMEQMLKMMEMVKLLQNFMPQAQDDSVPKTPYAHMEGIQPVKYPRLPVTSMEYDEKIQSPALQTIKAAIPHLEHKYRKNMSVMVKLIEIQKLLSVYGENTAILQSVQEGDWRKNMLMSIRPYMTEQKQYTLDMLVKCIDISELVNKMKEVSGGEHND